MADKYKILLPTDFSETADHALEMSIELVEHSNAIVDILHIEDIPPDWAKLVENAKDNMYLSIKQRLDSLRKELNKRKTKLEDKGIDARDFLAFNLSYRAILDHADEHKSDLIVMGAHGLTGIRRLLIGSRTRKVLHSTNLPVLVTKKDDSPHHFKKMVFVSDFSPVFLNPFKKVIEFAEKFGTSIHLLFVNSPTTFKETPVIKERMEEYKELVPAGMMERVSVYNAFLFEEGLEAYCRENEIDMISVLLYSKQHSWRVLGTKIEDLINHVHMPVLAIPEK